MASIVLNIDTAPRDAENKLDINKLPRLSKVKSVVISGKTYPVNHNLMPRDKINFYKLCSKSCLESRNDFDECRGNHLLIVCTNEICHLCNTPGHRDYICPNHVSN